MRVVKAAIWAVIGLVVVIALIAGGVWIWSSYQKVPLPIEDRCTASAGGNNVTITADQAHWASIIAGVSVQRGLKPRAASIALATAFQESGLRNLDYGHADSLGLFQQRPSKGWGTKEQVTDPWYASASFYREMVKVKHWDTKDIGDVAQAVQRSAYPDAYDKHVDKSRTLASSLAGETPASLTCIFGSPEPGDVAGLQEFLEKTYGNVITVIPDGATLQVTSKTAKQAWSVAHAAVANSGGFGVASVALGGYSWTANASAPASWQSTAPSASTEVLITFTVATASPR